MTLAVLQVVRPAAGGIRAHVISLVESTDPARFTHTVAAPAAFLSTLPDTLPAHRFPLEIVARLAPAADVRAALRLSRLVRADTPVVHAHGLRAGWVASLAHLVRPFPLLLTAHNMAEGGILSRAALGLMGRRATSIVAVSQAVAETLAAGGVPRAKVRVVPNGVDLAHFADLPARDAARRALGIRPDRFAVACVARLSREKGVDTLLAAARLLPEMEFLVAGDGPLRDELEQTLPANVRLLGRVPDTRPLLAAADAVAVPSRMEGQGIAALEAMAARVPVVASRVGGLAGMLTEGSTALLVPPSEPDALAAALVRLRDAPALRADLADNGARLVAERYTLAQMAAAVQEIYDACASPLLPLSVRP